jgi:hypothetical protein
VDCGQPLQAIDDRPHIIFRCGNIEDRQRNAQEDGLDELPLPMWLPQPSTALEFRRKVNFLMLDSSVE